MTSAYLATSFLKQTSLPEKQLRIFLSYLPQKPLKEYLYNADIYKEGRKHDLTDMIFAEKNKKIVYSQEDDDLPKAKGNELLKNNSFVKRNSTPEIKAKSKLNIHTVLN